MMSTSSVWERIKKKSTIVGESMDAIERSPHLEAFKERDIEVLYLSDTVIDEWMMGNLFNYQEKQLKSVGQGEVELGTEEERKAAEEERKTSEEASSELLSCLKNVLDEHIKEVRFSSRLVNSPACLVVEDGGMSPSMMRMLSQMNQDVPT